MRTYYLDEDIFFSNTFATSVARNGIYSVYQWEKELAYDGDAGSWSTAKFIGRVFVEAGSTKVKIYLNDILAALKNVDDSLKVEGNAMDAAHISPVEENYTLYKVALNMYSGETITDTYEQTFQVCLNSRYPALNSSTLLTGLSDVSGATDAKINVFMEGYDNDTNTCTLYPHIPGNSDDYFEYGYLVYPTVKYLQMAGYGWNSVVADADGSNSGTVSSEHTFYAYPQYVMNSGFTVSTEGKYYGLGAKKAATVYGIVAESIKEGSTEAEARAILLNYMTEEEADFTISKVKAGKKVLIYTTGDVAEDKKNFAILNAYLECENDTYSSVYNCSVTATINDAVLNPDDLYQFILGNMESSFGVLNYDMIESCKELVENGTVSFKVYDDNAESDLEDFTNCDTTGITLNIDVYDYQQLYNDVGIDNIKDSFVEAFGVSSEEAATQAENLTDGKTAVFDFFTDETHAQQAVSKWQKIMYEEYDAAMVDYDTSYDYNDSTKESYSVTKYSAVNIPTTTDTFIKLAKVDMCPSRYYLMWYDRMGGIQCQAFEGYATFSEGFESTLTQNAYGEKRIGNAVITPKWKLISGWIKDEAYPIYESLFVSPYLVMVDTENRKCFNVIPTDTSYTENNYSNAGHKLVNLTINLEMNKKQNLFY